MMMDRGAHPFADFMRPVSDVTIVTFTILEVPIASLANLAGFIDQAKSGAKLLDPLINRNCRQGRNLRFSNGL